MPNNLAVIEGNKVKEGVVYLFYVTRYGIKIFKCKEGSDLPKYTDNDNNLNDLLSAYEEIKSQYDGDYFSYSEALEEIDDLVKTSKSSIYLLFNVKINTTVSDSHIGCDCFSLVLDLLGEIESINEYCNIKQKIISITIDNCNFAAIKPINGINEEDFEGTIETISTTGEATSREVIEGDFEPHDLSVDNFSNIKEIHINNCKNIKKLSLNGIWLNNTTNNVENFPNLYI